MDGEKRLWLLLVLKGPQLWDRVLLGYLDEYPVAWLHKTLPKILLGSTTLFKLLFLDFVQIFVEVLTISFLSSVITLIISASSTFLFSIGGRFVLVIGPSPKASEKPSSFLCHGYLQLVFKDVVVLVKGFVCLELIIQTIRFQLCSLSSEMTRRFVCLTMVDPIIVLYSPRVKIVKQVLYLDPQTVSQDDQEY